MIEIAKMLILSTSHIPEKHARAMDAGAPFPDDTRGDDLSYDRVEYGYLVWVNEDRALASKLPQPWPDLFALAKKYGCRWIKLDCDGPVVPDYPTWEW